MSRSALDKNGKGDVGFFLVSVEMVMFLLYPDRVFVEGDTVSNIGFVALVDFSVFV